MSTIQLIPDEAGLGNAINLIQQLNKKVTGVELSPNVDKYLSFLVPPQLPYVETMMQTGDFTNFLNKCNTNVTASLEVTCYYEALNLGNPQHNKLLYFNLLNEFIRTYTTAANFESAYKKVLSYSPNVEIMNPISIRNLEIVDKPRGGKDRFWAFSLTFNINFTIMDCLDEDC